MVRITTHREPTHPDEMLLQEFLKPMDISQRELADIIKAKKAVILFLEGEISEFIKRHIIHSFSIGLCGCCAN